MEVRFGNEYVVVVDKLNFTLYSINKILEITSKNYGMEKRIKLGYYTHMKHVLQRIVKEETKVDSNLTIEEYLNHFETIEGKLLELIDNIYVNKKLSRKDLQK